MSSSRSNVLPIYMQIYESIRRRIKSGELKVGDRLEPERQIAAEFGVSLMTARQALHCLEEQGLVERKHGAGTFVRAPRINWNRLMSFTEQMAARGLKASSRLIGSAVARADESIAEQLQVPEGTRLLQVERLRLGNGEPVALETCLFPLDLFPELANYPLDRCSLFEILESHYHVRISHAEETVEADQPGKRIGKLLEIKPQSAVLHVEQVLFALGKRPIAISRSWYRADRNIFKVIRTRSQALQPLDG